MRFLVPSAAKLNLSLRVTSLRPDGYHDIVSLFVRLPSVETLTISRSDGGDAVRVRGMEIEGENIVSRALRNARDAGFDVPCMDVEISKTLFPGSGLGAGSGNGAALLRWLATDEPRWRDVARRTGADVPFLFAGCPMALVSGIGERVEPLVPPRLHAWVAFPGWSVGTENAYGMLDRLCCGAYSLNDLEARAEADSLLRRLRAEERIGFLPNDFAPPLMEKFPDYDKLFALFDSAGSCAWGITGSGAAAFALFYDVPRPLSVPWPDGVKQVLSVFPG